MVRSLMYRSPLIYNSAMRLLHGRSLERRYEFIAKETGSGRRVFDVGCGTGILADFLDESCRYSGIDLNDGFLDYAKNKKNLDVRKGDLLDENNYPDCDVIVVCDVLHHITPRHSQLVGICRKKAGKIIICEPFNHTKGFRNKLANQLRSMRWYHTLFGDSDGVNGFKNMREWNLYGKDDVIEMLKEYGSRKTIVMGSHVIGVIETVKNKKDLFSHRSYPS